MGKNLKGKECGKGIYEKVKDIIGIGEGETHRKHADDGRSDAIAIPVGFQRD